MDTTPPLVARPRRPTHLGLQGKRLWDRIVGDFTLRPDELRILEDACREADLVDRIDGELRDAPLTVPGSMGQPVASPLVQEVRQHRAVLKTLLAQLKLTEDGETEAVARSASARAAANARWGRGA